MLARLTRHYDPGTAMTPKRIQTVGSSKHRLVTVSLPANEFEWLNEFVAALESAGYRRTRSAIVRVALAELRGTVPDGPPNEILKHWLRRDTERLIAAIDDNSTEPDKSGGRPRRVPK